MQKVNMSKGANNEFLRIIAHLLEDPYNRVCADCQCKPSKWASTTLGVFICIECSGVHRSLGTHISFVRSCTLDEWSLPQVRLMQAIGNRLANIYWEKNLPSDFERPGPANRSLMQLFIKQKYALKKWADFGPPPHIVFQTLPIENQEAVAERRSRPRTRRERKEKKPLQFNRSAEEKEVVIAERAKEETLDEFFEDAPKRSVPRPVKPHQPKRVEMPNQNPETVGELEHVIDDFFKAEMEANLGLEVKKTAPKSVSMDSMGQAGERANVQKLKQFFGHEQPVPVASQAAEEEEVSGNGEEESEEKDNGKMPTLNLMNVEFESIPDVTDTAGLESFFDAEEPDHSVKIEELSRKLEAAGGKEAENAAAEAKAEVEEQECDVPAEEEMQDVTAAVEAQTQTVNETRETETNEVTGAMEEEAIQEEEEQEAIQEEEERHENVKKNSFDFLNVEFESMPVAADTADLESFFSDGGDGYANLDEPVPAALAKSDHEPPTGEIAEHLEEEASNERPTLELQVTKCIENELKAEDKQPPAEPQEQPQPALQQDSEQPEESQEQSQLVIQQEPEQPKESTGGEEIQTPIPAPEKPKLRFSFVTTNLVHVESSIPPQPPAQQKKSDKVQIESPQPSGFDPNADPFLNPELDLESFFEAPAPNGRPMSAPSSATVSESQLDNLIDDFFGDAQGSLSKNSTTKSTSSTRKPTTSQTSDSNNAKPEPKVKSMTLMAVQKRKAKEERESRRERGHHHHHRHREVEPPQPAPVVPKKVLTFESDDDEEEPQVEVAQPQKSSLAPPGTKKPGATPPLRMQKRMEAEEAMRKRSSHRRHRTNR